MTMEDQKIANRDYRLQAVTTLAEDWTNPGSGVTHKMGTEVIVSGSVQYNKKHILSFGLPNMTALFLDQAYKAWQESQQLLQREQFLDSPSKYMPNGTINPKDDASFFDLLEKRMVAIVFAYTALESFANESIPSDYIFRRERDDKKCMEEYKKEQAEILSLDTKLNYVLPSIYSVKPPKGFSVWHKYIFIKKVRDRIIHMKSKDRRPTSVNDETIWKELLNNLHVNVAIDAKIIIGYYLKNASPKPRWFDTFPWTD